MEYGAEKGNITDIPNGVQEIFDRITSRAFNLIETRGCALEKKLTETRKDMHRPPIGECPPFDLSIRENAKKKRVYKKKFYEGKGKSATNGHTGVIVLLEVTKGFL